MTHIGRDFHHQASSILTAEPQRLLANVNRLNGGGYGFDVLNVDGFRRLRGPRNNRKCSYR
jgi:hypothetical protein